MKSNKVTQLLINAGFSFGGYLKPKTTLLESADLAAKELWTMRGYIRGLKRDEKAFVPFTGWGNPDDQVPADYREEYARGVRAGLHDTMTKSGVKAALIAIGYTEFPNALKDTVASAGFISAEREWAEYLIHDTDGGGAWNDDEQINMHLK